jgi:hypothetical protein
MENKGMNEAANAEEKQQSGCLRRLGIIGIITLIVLVIAGVWIKHNLYASKYTPTELSTKEEKVLNSKIERIHDSAEQQHFRQRRSEYNSKGHLKPEPYSEKSARREISLTEREVNALIAHTPEMAERVAIHLSDDLVSIKLVVPVDEEVAFLGGKTLRLNLGLVLSYQEGKPVVALKGLSLGGIPMPNAWLGYMKNKNLVDEFGSEGGFWQLFAEGVKNIRVRDGHLQVELKE